MNLCERILAGPEGRLGRGLPIGNLTSQWFANLLLGRLDRFVLERQGVPGYLRYMDDFALFADDKALLRRALASIGTYLGDELHLALKERATILAPVSQGLPFLGWRIYRGTARLRPENARRTRRRLRHRRWELRRGRLAPERYVEAVRSVLGHLGQGDTLAWRRDELVALWADESELGVGSPRLQNPRQPRRQLQQRRLERAFGEPQRRHAGEPQHEPRPPALQGVAAPDRVGPALAPRP